jgi:hypothetical protein
MYRQLSERIYCDMVRHVRKKGCATKNGLFAEFGQIIGYKGTIQALERMKAEGIIADNPDGWLCESKRVKNP